MLSKEREKYIRSLATSKKYPILYFGMITDLLAEVDALRALCKRVAETMKMELQELDKNDEWTGAYYHEELINELKAAGGE